MLVYRAELTIFQFSHALDGRYTVWAHYLENLLAGFLQNTRMHDEEVYRVR